MNRKFQAIINKKNAMIAIPLLLIGILATIIDNDFILFADYIGFYIFIAYYFRDILINYIFFVIHYFWNMLSVFAIENFNIPVANMAMMSEHTGALKLLVWANVVFFLCLIHFDVNIKKRAVKPAHNIFSDKRKYLLIYLFVLVFILFLLFNIVGNNYYSSGATDRYSYALNATSLSLRLYGWFIYLIPVASIYSIMKKDRRPIIVISLLYFFYLFLIGDKFGGFLQEIYLLTISYIMPEHIINKSRFNIKKIAIVLCIAGVSLVLFCLYQYYIKNGTMEAALTELFNRVFNGQGDVWWGVFRYCKKTGFHLNEIGDEMTALSVTTDDQYLYNFGIYKMMKIISPDRIVQHYARQHVRFAMSTDASFYYYFGAAGVIIWRALGAFAIAKISNGLTRACINLLPASAFLYSWILVAFLGIALQSSFGIIITKTNFMTLILLFFLYIYHYGYNRGATKKTILCKCSPAKQST